MTGKRTPERRNWHYGRDDSEVLVIRAPSVAMNPTLDEKLIAAEIERDPAIGRAEWLAEWRDDLASFVSRELIEAAVDSGVSVRPCIPGVRYHCMIDPSGGVGDSMTLGIAHRETDGRVVLDAVVERPAPFHAQAIVTECCAAAK